MGLVGYDCAPAVFNVSAIASGETILNSSAILMLRETTYEQTVPRMIG
jgi:hypothetical protein